jgi:hydroxymethylglutaryl-CoA reductase (NADPH)
VAVSNLQARRILERLLGDGNVEDGLEVLLPRTPRQEPLPPHLPASADRTAPAVQKRRLVLEQAGIGTGNLAGHGPAESPEDLEGNIENLIGFARMPVGVIGPLRVNGSEARGDFYVPLATTEGALVASYDRGANLVSQAGGVSALCLSESVLRAPCFQFASMREAGRFLAWVLPRFDGFQEIVNRTSRHCRLEDMRTSLTGKEVFLVFEFTTGDASGQNMVTLATEEICRTLVAESPQKPKRWFLEGNMSGDKKATMLAFLSTRGKDVVAEAAVPAKLVRHYLHTTPEEMVAYWQISVAGGILSGSIGVQGHYANAIAAMFIACGQDVACVAEAAVGLTRMDLAADGGLYVSVKLPNLIVGTVGGGTHLSTARECLEMIGCAGSGRARKFAEICAATVLAGEVSIIGALAAGHFGRAHAALGRKKPPPKTAEG